MHPIPVPVKPNTENRLLCVVGASLATWGMIQGYMHLYSSPDGGSFWQWALYTGEVAAGAWITGEECVNAWDHFRDDIYYDCGNGVKAVNPQWVIDHDHWGLTKHEWIKKFYAEYFCDLDGNAWLP